LFNRESYSRKTARCGHVRSNQYVLIYTIHVTKVIAKLCVFILRTKITEKQLQIRNFAEVRNFTWHRDQFQKIFDSVSGSRSERKTQNPTTVHSGTPESSPSLL